MILPENSNHQSGVVDLSLFDNAWYQPGRGVLMRLLWLVVNALVLQSPLNPSSALKVLALRLFGARIGRGVNIKPGINVKYPWNIEIGDYAWIGENAWLDSLAPIRIGAHSCVSQGVYCCTGNHDWTDPTFSLIVKPINIEDGAWVGARSVILPGVTVTSHSVVAAGSVVAKSTEPYMIYAGNPAVPVKKRIIRENSTSL
jgi:putative colanic acid biosynthesis acetyltransferase WcaF